MKHLLLGLPVVAAIAACHASPRPALSADQRAAASLARWAHALEREDNGSIGEASDAVGQFAIVYGGIKLAASHVDGGATAVESTVFGLVLCAFFCDARETWDLVVPTGALGPALVAAGLVRPPLASDDQTFAYIPVSTQQTFGKLDEAARAHQAKLREKRAWTCKFVAIEKAILPAEPIVQRAAAVSTVIFARWLEPVEQLWLVRATCASGPALFAVTAREDGNDKVLLAKLL